MDNLNLNKILKREKEETILKDFVNNFDYTNKNIVSKKGLFLYGDAGTGKSTFVLNILKQLNVDIIQYNASDVRNKTIIETITKHNMSNKNIISLLNKKIRRPVILMDEMDAMTNGDKGGITSLIKIIRPKKTKKQKVEDTSFIPIIFISNYHMDKKIKELMKVCVNVELKKPLKKEMMEIINTLFLEIHEINIKTNIYEYVLGDLKKLRNIYDIYVNDKTIITPYILQNVFQSKSYNDNINVITKTLIKDNYPMKEHIILINETDRTIVGLLWHENIIDQIENVDKKISIPFYLNVLENICFSDYIDRITFQKQIWQFNEMSSLIKTFKNNKLYHTTFPNHPFLLNEVRFTKVLTKYASEYNNSIFIQHLCQQLMMDKKDMFLFFLVLKEKYNSDVNEIFNLFENYEISKLDINRIYRYLEKNIKETEDNLLIEVKEDDLNDG
jgi:DNA polymerase III delta prime subunit